MAQKHSCEKCRNYQKSTGIRAIYICYMASEVANKHGIRKLDDWLYDDKKTNTCSFFKPE